MTEPSTNPVVQAFIVYLTYQRISLGELIEARMRIERSIARLAADRADDADIEALRELAATDREPRRLDPADHHVLHTMIAHAARNPAAELFIDVLGRLTARWSYPDRPADRRTAALDASAQAHERIVDAITAGEAARSRTSHGHATSRRSATGSAATERPRGRSSGCSTTARATSWAARSPAAIIVDIVDRNWPIGKVLGSESSSSRSTTSAGPRSEKRYACSSTTRWRR